MAAEDNTGPYRGFEHLELALHTPGFAGFAVQHYGKWLNDNYPDEMAGFATLHRLDRPRRRVRGVIGTSRYASIVGASGASPTRLNTITRWESGTAASVSSLRLRTTPPSIEASAVITTIGLASSVKTALPASRHASSAMSFSGPSGRWMPTALASSERR